MIVWIIGLSGSGKSTIGKELYKLWKPRAPNTVLIDGDEIRKVFGATDGSTSYTPEARRLNADRVVRLCQWLDAQHINAVCCILSAFQEHRTRCRETVSRYHEVYMDVPFQELVDRDGKDLYRRALAGELKNVVGVDIDFEPASNADTRIDNAGFGRAPAAVAREIFDELGTECDP